MTVFLDFVASTVKAFFLFMTFDFVKVTIKSRLHVGPTINFVHYFQNQEEGVVEDTLFFEINLVFVR